MPPQYNELGGNVERQNIEAGWNNVQTRHATYFQSC